jgi:hypothetical protein
MLRTAYLAAEYRDLDTQIAHAIRDSRTVLIYGNPTQRARVAAALLAAEKTLRRSLTCTREHDRWVISRQH